METILSLWGSKLGYRKITNLYRNKDILLFKECFAMEKIHGTSAHIAYNKAEDKITYFSGGAKHENFVKIFDNEQLLEIFRRNAEEYPDTERIVIYGEAYGGKMQAMKNVYGPELKFIAFEVLFNKNEWRSVLQAERFLEKQGFPIEFVHYVRIPTTEEAINEQMMADSVQAVRNGMGEGHMREGVVLRPLIEMVHPNGGRIMCKHKRPEFAEREHTPKFTDPEELKQMEDAKAIAEEWVVPGRIMNARSHFPEEEWKLKYMSKIIKYLINDVVVEAGEEIVDNKMVRKAISKKAAKLLLQELKD